MVVVVLMMVSFALFIVILATVLISVQRETARARNVASLGESELLSSIKFAFLEPLDLRIDPKESLTYKSTLSRVLVSDYLQSPDICRVVDEGFPRRGYRPAIRPLSAGPPA